jgi:hypothetical protein
VLTADGVVLTFGNNGLGQLGRCARGSVNFEPGVVELPGGVVDLAASGFRTGVVFSDRRMVTFGLGRTADGLVFDQLPI